jgi:hypothetical protein
MKNFEMLKNILTAGNYTTSTKTNKKEEYVGVCTIKHFDHVIDVSHFKDDVVNSQHMSGSTNATHTCTLKKASGKTVEFEGIGFSKRLNKPVQVKRITKNKDGRIITKLYVKGYADKEYKLHKKIISKLIVS